MEKDNSGNDIEWKNKNFSFFNNKKCEFFPCHKSKDMKREDFNCIFCYCPLYDYMDCGGNYKILDNGTKDCSGCIVPHKKDNYGYIIGKLKEKRQG